MVKLYSDVYILKKHIQFQHLYVINIVLGFLCPLSANTYGIDFLQFTISDYVSKKIVFEVGRNTPPQDMSIDFSTGGEDMYRKIKYEFSEDVLRLPHIETSLVQLLFLFTCTHKYLIISFLSIMIY